METLKWFVILLIYVLVLLIIKNIQIILPILFEYQEIVLLIISYLLSIIIIVLNCFAKRHNKTKQVDDERDDIR